VTVATLVLISSRRRIKFRIFFAEKVFFNRYPHTMCPVVRALNFVEASAIVHIFQNTDYEF
jgi:hypothetical protein